MGTSLLDEYHQQQSAQSPDSSSLLDEYRAQQKPDTSSSLLDQYRATVALRNTPVLSGHLAPPGVAFRPDATAVAAPPALPQPTVHAASSLTAATQAPAPVTPADRLLSGQSGYPLVDVGSDVLFGRGRLGKAASMTPLFLAQQGAQAGQAAGQGRYGEAALRLGVGAALGASGELAGGLLRRAGTPVADAATFEQNPTLPEALSPAVNETLAPSAAAANVRRSLVRRPPVATPQPAEPVQGFMNWAQAAEDPETSPMLREYAAQRANAARPAAQAVFAEQAATPFPGEPGAPPAPPEAPEEPRPEGFMFSEPLGSEARASEPAAGAEASPEELQEMFGGPGLPAKARKSLRQIYRSGFIEPYPLLDQPSDQPLKGSMNEVGAAHTYGNALATYGVGSARATVPAEKVAQIEAQINAYNATARADARQRALEALGPDGSPSAKAQLAQQVANLHAHAARYQKIAGPDIARDADYGKYVNAFNQVVSPELKRLAIQGGLPEERLLSIPNNAPYVPMAADIEKAVPPAVLAPVVPRRAGTALSSATKAATGGAEDYLNDVAEQVRQVAGNRQRVAAGNQVWQKVKDAGRRVGADDALEPGEVRVAFTDKNQITTPTSPNATQFVAVPDRVAQSVSDYLVRNGPPKKPASAFGRALAALQSKATAGATKIAPIMTKVHGYNIVSTVGQTPGPSLAGNVASSLPFGAQVGGVASLTGIDFTDPAVASQMIEYARYGGTHPIATELATRPLFGAAGMDPRGRYVLAQRYKALHPGASPAEVSQYLTENLGNYNRANQPAFVSGGQSTGLTTFAPAGVAFTRSAARRVLPIFPGMTAGERLATLGRTVGSAVGGAEAVSYLKTGHSTFANPPGHRLDVDLGSKNDQNQENYLRFGAMFPMVDRGLRMTGIGPLVEGQGVGGVARGPINEALTQTGVLPRAALAVGMNAQPRLGPGLTAVTAAPPQFSEGRTLANMGMRGIFGSLGAVSALGGLSPYDADRPLGQRAADAFGLNFTSQGTRGGKASVPAGYDEKLQTAIYKVSDAKTMAEKQAIIQQEVRDATDAGYQGWYIENLRKTLAKTAGKTMPHAAP